MEVGIADLKIKKLRIEIQLKIANEDETKAACQIEQQDLADREAEKELNYKEHLSYYRKLKIIIILTFISLFHHGFGWYRTCSSN